MKTKTQQIIALIKERDRAQSNLVDMTEEKQSWQDEAIELRRKFEQARRDALNEAADFIANQPILQKDLERPIKSHEPRIVLSRRDITLADALRTFALKPLGDQSNG